jgi:pimeloyl-ACP methyl ester carboxylesterase
MKTMGISQVNAITHSEGAIVLAEAAKKNSKFFRNVIMVEPAGISKSKTDNPWVAAGILSVSGALDTALEKVRIEKGALENKAKKYAAEHEIEAPEILSQIDRQLGIKERLAALEAKLGLKTPKNFDPERARQNAAIGKENAAISAKADFRRIISAIPVIARYQIGETMVELRKKGIKIVIFQGVDDQFFDARSVMENLPKGSYDNVVSIGGTHGQVSLQAEAHSDAFSDTFKSLEWKRTREGSGRIVPFEKSHKEQKQIHPDQDIKVLYRPKKKRSGISA